MSHICSAQYRMHEKWHNWLCVIRCIEWKPNAMLFYRNWHNDNMFYAHSHDTPVSIWKWKEYKITRKINCHYYHFPGICANDYCLCASNAIIHCTTPLYTCSVCECRRDIIFCIVNLRTFHIRTNRWRGHNNDTAIFQRNQWLEMGHISLAILCDHIQMSS